MRTIPMLCLALAALLLGRPSPATSQVTRADSAAVILATAASFEARGRQEVAEALYRYLAERFGDTPAAAEARTALSRPAAQVTSRGSQVELTVWSTLYGLWLGVAVPGALGADDSAPYGLGLLLGGPGGFLAGRSLARSRPLSEGQVRAITFGGTWGTWQGLGWSMVGDAGGRETLSAMVAGGVAGIATGAALSRKPISSGVATTANFGALWGSWFGVAGSVLADLEGDELLAATLLAGNAGLLATSLMAPGWGLSRERARLISLGGVIGGLGGAGLDLIIQPDNEKVAIAIPLATSIAGLVLGAHWTRDAPPGASFESAASAAAQPGVLLDRRDGRWSVGVPAPFPALLPAPPGGEGPSWRAALGLPLLRVAFH